MKIEIKDNTNGDNTKRVEFPLDYEYFGEEEHKDDLKIFIREDALDRIDDYLSSDTNNELGGVLIGDICINSDGRKFILIDNLIIAKHSNSSLSRLTFTHETWDYINEVLEKDFAGKKILGWFHSHPGHTVFLSNFDMFIQENFFNMEYMVAYVFDPTIKERGFFLWRNNKIVKSDGFYICDILIKDEEKEINFDIHGDDLLTVNTPQDTGKKISKANYKNLVTIALLILTLMLLLLIIYNFYDFKQKALLKEVYARDLAELKNENKKLADRLNEYILESELKKNPPKLTNNNSSGISEPEKNNTVNTNNTVNNISQSNTEKQEKDPSIQVTKYKVKSGDTLEKISNQFYKSRAGIDLIMKQNNIKNKADIKIGQELELPNINQ